MDLGSLNICGLGSERKYFLDMRHSHISEIMDSEGAERLV